MIDPTIFPNHLLDGVEALSRDWKPDHIVRELRARKYYQDLALAGDVEAKLILKTHWKLTRLVLNGKEIF